MPRRKKTGHSPGRPNKQMELATRQQVLRMYSDGKTLEEMAVSLQLLPKTIDRHLNEALDALVSQWAKPSPEHTFVRYAAFQLGIIAKLKESYEVFINDESGKAHGAVVSSLRAQSDIMDKIVQKGHDFGVISQRRADKTLNMSKSDLRQELKNEIEMLSSILTKVDNHDVFLRRRQRNATPSSTRLLARIRKVKRNSSGFVTAIPDWKFSKLRHKELGTFIPQVNPVPTDHRFFEETTELDVTLEQVDSKLQEEYANRPSSQDPAPSLVGYDVPTDTPLK